ncbi:hypothetical protein OXT66_03080 [Lentilactobacillus senioris]|uniref:hypothetical protein n=1 Tax=Lentilactobacillus senioris TaxID=931534 RepID=UPI0022818B0B|nr:hypothetical protein [Lentilactobacillus senioris]MCY9806532.1 hypothetical protein [Lentilactobacillus senioris]
MNISNFKTVVDVSSFKPLLKITGQQDGNKQFFTVASKIMGLSTAFRNHHPSYKSVEIRINKQQLLLIFKREVEKFDSKTWSVHSTGTGYAFGSDAIVKQIKKASKTMNKENRYRFDVEPIGDDMYLVNIDRPIQVFNAINRH